MTHDLRALTREWFTGAWNNRDESLITRLAAPQVVSHGLGEPREGETGVDNFKRFYRNFLSAFPDLHIDVQDVFLDGDTSIARFSITGTHLGDGIGFPPTRRRFAATAIAILRWRDGKIIEAWNEFDAAGMLRQLQPPTP